MSFHGPGSAGTGWGSWGVRNSPRVVYRPPSGLDHTKVPGSGWVTVQPAPCLTLWSWGQSGPRLIRMVAPPVWWLWEWSMWPVWAGWRQTCAVRPHGRPRSGHPPAPGADRRPGAASGSESQKPILVRRTARWMAGMASGKRWVIWSRVVPSLRQNRWPLVRAGVLVVRARTSGSSAKRLAGVWSRRHRSCSTYQPGFGPVGRSTTASAQLRGGGREGGDRAEEVCPGRVQVER
jgi:hypothetical protein